MSLVATITGDGVRIHKDPNQSSPANGEAFKGDRFDVDSCTDGGGDDSCGGTTWFHGTDERTRVTGWVSGCFISGVVCIEEAVKKAE